MTERTILVTGGTGALGSAVASGLLARGHRVRVASRRPAPARSRPEWFIEGSGRPHTILRATQFHDLVRVACAALARSPVMFVPDLPMQPVDPADVAGRLVERATGPPAGRAPDVGGPEVRPLHDLAAEYLDAVGRTRRMRPFRLPGRVFAAYRAGCHTAPERRSAGRTFAEHLAAPDRK